MVLFPALANDMPKIQKLWLVGICALMTVASAGAQDFEPAAKRFSRDPGSQGQLEAADVPGMIGLAAVAEQYGDQNKADGYYNQALGILNQPSIWRDRVYFSL